MGANWTVITYQGDAQVIGCALPFLDCVCRSAVAVRSEFWWDPSNWWLTTGVVHPWVRVDAERFMADEQRDDAEQGQALRDEAIAICRQAGWTPRCLGQQGFTPGISEIYEELRCLQQVLAVDVAQELIDCCRKHQQWSPLFEDVEARIALFQGEVDRAEAVWDRLIDHPSTIVQRIAAQARLSLKAKRVSGDQLVMDVVQMLDRNQLSRVHSMLLDAVLTAKDLDAEKLRKALEPVAMGRPKPEHWPRNRALLIDQVVLDLFDQQLASWESHVD